MAKGVKTGGKNFQKGKPGGPGRPKILPEAKGLPPLDRSSYNRLLNEALGMTQKQLKDRINDPKATMLQKWIASIVVKGTSSGDTSRLEALLGRAIGPVKQQLEHSGPDGGKFEIIVKDYRDDEDE